MASFSCKYDVFLSFRGKDTRDNFTSHLYAALCRKQIITFIDDEKISRGDDISPALLNAIEGSKISVIIFSKDYASSKWCLNELAKILECKNMNGQMVVPVFYHVDPSDVRKQTGSFGDAFVKHDEQFKDMPEKLQTWRAVLTEASNLSGWASEEIRSEAQLVDLIVNDILNKLEKLTVSTYSDGFVGLNSRVEEMKSLLRMELSDAVQIVGIWGMGGIGKTTLATAIFNQFSVEFEGKCFMENVRRKSEIFDGLENLQKQILSTILREKLEVLGLNIPQFTKERVRRMKVFIVLDDVNKVGQLDYLIEGLDQFAPGSRIVVTTRDKRVLEDFGVDKIYRVNGLDDHEAFELFCNYAFKENHCPEDLKGHSWRVVGYGKGNPLTLKVLGSSLRSKKSKTDWENILDNLNEIYSSDIYGQLRICFNDLKPREKSIFLDIACFFVGEDKDFVTRILDDSKTYALNVLLDKSLVTTSNKNFLHMHDLLQEMGREIVRQESMKEPSNRSRLWYHKDVYHVLKQNKGTDKIEGIFLDLSETKDIRLASGAFLNMPNLRLLKFYMPVSKYYDVPILCSKVHLDQGLEWLPKELRYLHWHQYPLKTLPFHFKPKYLTELYLPFSKVEQLWQGKKKAFKLKSIDLNHSQYFTRMPEPSETPNLERTNLWNCTNLARVPSSIQNFNHLSMLCLKGCKSLRSFPRNLHFVCPVTIDFSSCVNLTEFPKISGNITSLNLQETAIEEVPSSVGCLTNLKLLSLEYCTRLKRLSTSICKLKSLRELRLDDCLNLESFPEILEKMEHLNFIMLHGTSITKLPSSIENLEVLQCLYLSGCSKLDNLPDNIGNLKSLSYISASRTAIRQLPSSIAFSNELSYLSLSECRGLVSLPQLSLSGLSSLERLDLSGCALMEIPQDIGCLSSLKCLFLSGNSFESLPGSIKQLSRLTNLDLRECNMLQSLPELPLSLTSLVATNCKRLQSLPEIPSCLQELDTSILEKLTKYSHKSGSLPMAFLFTNCLKLNETENKKILADSQLRIQHMAIASLGIYYEEKCCEFKAPNIFLPGSKIPDWFSNQSWGSSVTVQLQQHSCRNLIGFAICAVIDFKHVYPSFFAVGFKCVFETKTSSETKQAVKFCFLNYISDSFYLDHVVLGFDPSGDIGLPDGNHNTTVSFEFFSNTCYDGYKVKRCGVCPVYANPNETKPNTFALNFAAGRE